MASFRWSTLSPAKYDCPIFPRPKTHTPDFKFEVGPIFPAVMARIDPLFEFDAPQSYRDLSAPLSPLPAGEHDPWFDRVHPEHSRLGAELRASWRPSYRSRNSSSSRRTRRTSVQSLLIGGASSRPGTSS